jgi:hypothetical protein
MLENAVLPGLSKMPFSGIKIVLLEGPRSAGSRLCDPNRNAGCCAHSGLLEHKQPKTLNREVRSLLKASEKLKCEKC